MGEENACNAGDAGDTGSIPGSGRSPVEGNDYLLQYSCLENAMDRGSWKATVHRLQRIGCDWAYAHNSFGFPGIFYDTFLSL